MPHLPFYILPPMAVLMWWIFLWNYLVPFLCLDFVLPSYLDCSAVKPAWAPAFYWVFCLPLYLLGSEFSFCRSALPYHRSFVGVRWSGLLRLGRSAVLGHHLPGALRFCRMRVLRTCFSCLIPA